MSTGWMAWACLMLASGAPGNADDVVYINQRNFKIPIRVVPAKRAEIRDLYLYLSRNQGQNWEIYSRSTPDKDSFEFSTDRDGLYYFSIAVIDHKGKQDPPDLYRARVGQKIFIDTVKPVVQIVSATYVGEQLQVGWQVREDHPEWTSLKLEYRLGDSPAAQWVPLPVEPRDSGVQRFRPGVAGPITIRLRLRDLAGNEGVAERIVTGPDRAVVSNSGIVPAGGLPPPPPPPPAPVGVPAPPTEEASRGPGSATLASSSPVSPTPAPPPPGPAPTAMPSRGALPALQIVNKRQVKLRFEVGRFGPSGLGSVDVYVTNDEGATWEKSLADPNVSLPAGGEVRGQGPVRGTVTVNLPRDGVVYGFYLVVKSRAGLGKPPPRPGDPPQARIEVDTTLPNAVLYEPKADPARGDRLMLHWKAEDRNLAANPISLEWSASPDGPWTFIGDPQLPNTGAYPWQPPDNIPPKVYLRLSVRDKAGNNAIAQTPQPVLIDLVVPEAGAVTVDSQ